MFQFIINFQTASVIHYILDLSMKGIFKIVDTHKTLYKIRCIDNYCFLLYQNFYIIFIPKILFTYFLGQKGAFL